MRIYGCESDYQAEEARPYQKKGVLLYRTKTIKAGDYLECEIFPVVDIEKGEKSKRRKPSREAQKKLNIANAQKRLSRIMNANFGPGDLLVHLTMEKPCEEEEMRRGVGNFLRRLRRKMSKNGGVLKYIYVIESTGSGERKRWHVHMVMNGGYLSRDEVERLWKHGLSRVDRCQRQEKGLFGFAMYITQRKETQEKLLQRRWACSQGLKQPVILTSDKKFSRRAAMRIATAAEMDAREEFEKRYPGYQIIEQPTVKYSDMLPGAYIYAMMVKKEAL